MPSKTPFDGFNNTELQLTNQSVNPDIDDTLQQMLGRLLGFDADAKLWRVIRADSLGRLSVTLNKASSYKANGANISIGAGVGSLYIGANPNRISFIIRTYTYPIYVGSTLAAPTNKIYVVPPNSQFIDDSFTGDVYLTNPNTALTFVDWLELT